MIRVNNVIKDYISKDSTYRAIHGITIDFPDVQFVSILGPSGCGKTTLLNIIGGLDRPTSGDILVDDSSLTQMKDQNLDTYRNSTVGFIFQDYYLIPHMNVLDNVKLGLRIRGQKEEEIINKALEALDKVGIKDLANKKSNELSGGQTQRVAIARAMITNPRIILADEPTGALDSANSTQVMNILKELSKDRLVILVTHNEELAQKYSDRIVRMVDGLVTEDTLTPDIDNIHKEKEKETKKSKLPFLTALKIALNNMFSKKLKTILTCIANSFGMLGIGYFLAINNGFNEYATEVNRITASTLSVILTSYTSEVDGESFSETNASVLYPDTEEIYPTVSTSSITSYVFNNFTDKYFRYLDSLVDEGLATEYVINYGTSYSLNLTTEYPTSLDGEASSYIGTVSTTMTSSNSIASTARLPTSVFHSLYGNLDDYDLIAGSLPENENELVLVVSEYNSVSFSILRNLGFYNSTDTEADVKDTTLKTNVKPISFSDILGKKYKVFTNDDYYEISSTTTDMDAIGNSRTLTSYSRKNLNELYNSDKGVDLKISGIIRPKEDSDYGLLSPSLCYLPSLEEDIVKANLNSDMSTNLSNNVIFYPDGNIISATRFQDEMEEAIQDYMNGDTEVLPTSQVNSVLNKYFSYFNYRTGSYSSIQTIVNDARTLGIDIIPDVLEGFTLSNSEDAYELIQQGVTALRNEDYDRFYELMIGLSAYVNAYSLIQYVTIIPTSLSSRTEIIERLDQFNKIEEGRADRASNESEQVAYSSLNSSRALENVADIISLASMILIIFAIVSLTVSCSMTAILTLNSILERRKEIGLLRSIGARKKDILTLFEIEALIVGFFTGIVGSIATYLLSFPVNVLIYNSYPSYQATHIASFTFSHALIILAISVIISFMSALIPSIKAAKQDPVTCLRSE